MKKKSKSPRSVTGSSASTHIEPQAAAPAAALVMPSAERTLTSFQAYQLLQNSGLFDPAYYAKTYPDAVDSGMDLALHFLEIGASEGRRPSAAFDVDFYLRQCEHIGIRPENPILHYLFEGRARGLSFAPISGLTGYLDKVEVGDGFVVLTGWVAGKDRRMPAQCPLVLNVLGKSFPISQLEFRQDLADADIAGGYAGFCVAVPVTAEAGKALEIDLTSTDGQVCRLARPAGQTKVFRPSGTIEGLGPAGVVGWIFDPSLQFSQRQAVLRYDDEIDEIVSLNVPRADLPFQVISVGTAGKSKTCGFRKDIGAVLTRLESARKARKPFVVVKLISSGVVLFTKKLEISRPEPRIAAPAAPLPAPEETTRPSGKPRMLVVSWDMGHNPVGRAYLLADMARAHFDVKLIGPQFPEYGHALWGPLQGQKLLPVEIFPGGDMAEFLRNAVAAVERNRADVVYVSKPRLPSLIFGYMMQLRHGCSVVVDSDDHELSFFKSDTPLDLPAAIAAAAADPSGSRMPHSEIWTRLGEHLMRYAGAVTVSNVNLKKKFGGTIVRHARNEKTFVVSPKRRSEVRHEFGIKDNQIAILFLGTPRPHKGIYQIAEVLNKIHDPRLVFVIVGTINDARVRNHLAQYKHANIKYFDNQPWARLHEIVAMADVAPVLQVRDHRIAEFQIPAKLTDAMALQVPVLASMVPPLEDFRDSGAFCWIKDNQDLERILRQRLKSHQALAGYVSSGRKLYEREFTYANNAARIRSAAAQAQGKAAPAEIENALAAIFKHAGVHFPYSKTSQAAKRLVQPKGTRKTQRDLVFFWKQNDSDIYGRRSDMMVKYLMESGRFRKILQLDRPLNLAQLNAMADSGPYSATHEGNMVYLSTMKRLLKMADQRGVARRTFLHRSGSLPESFLGRELPPRDAYGDFVREALQECGMEPNPLAWVCPVVFDYPQINAQIRFQQTVVDIVDDQRRWAGAEDYKRRVDQNYADVLKTGTLVVANCEPVKQGFRDLRKDIVVVPNGAEIFPQNANWALPRDLADIPRPIVGYVGNLRDRVDVAAIREMAEKRPDWSIVLIGSSGGSLDVLALNLLPNVHLLGVRPYETALHYIKHFDVAIMPHVKNSISDNMNPLKLYVYFALGVPIVTTDVSNIGDIGPYVSVAGSTKAFIRAVDDNLKGKSVKVTQAARSAVLKKVSWQYRVDEILSRLKL